MIGEAIPATFNFAFHQTRNSESTVVEAKDGGNDREQKIFDQYKNVLDGSTLINEAAEFKLLFKIGEPKIISHEAQKYSIKDANGVVTGSAWEIIVRIEMERKLIIKNASNQEIYLFDLSGPGNYSFKKYSGGSSFPSQGAAEKEYEGKEEQCISKYLENSEIGWKQTIKYILKTDLSESTEKFELNVVTLEVGKKEQEKYADVISLTDRMLSTFEKVESEIKSGKNMNWHTAELKKEFQTMATDWTTIIQIEMDLYEKKQPLRFENIVLTGLVKNQLWCEFFASNYPPVSEYAVKFENQDNQSESNQDAFAAINDMRISWYKIVHSTKGYMRVYQACKDRMKWE